jgi:hypothetical protein
MSSFPDGLYRDFCFACWYFCLVLLEYPRSLFQLFGLVVLDGCNQSITAPYMNQLLASFSHDFRSSMRLVLIPWNAVSTRT